MRPADLTPHRSLAGCRMDRRKRRQPVGMRPDAFGIKPVLPGAGLRFLPIPAQQDGQFDAGGIHVAQQSIDVGESLHRPAVATAARAQRRPMRLAPRRRPARRIAADLGRIEVHVGVDDSHVG